MSPYHWRPMRAADLPHVMAIADLVHAGYFEAEEVFAERLALFAPGCRIAVRGGQADGTEQVIGYAFMHPARLGVPPSLNSLLNGLDTAADCLHLHDVALLPAARGSGLGRELVDDLCRVAEQAGLPMATLVAVHASSAYWRAAGFAEDGQALAGKGGSLASYGEGALYMSRRLR